MPARNRHHESFLCRRSVRSLRRWASQSIRVAVKGCHVAFITGQICPVIPERIAKMDIFREKKVNNFKARDEGQSLGKGEAVSSILTSSILTTLGFRTNAINVL